MELKTLADTALLNRLSILVAQEREDLAAVVSHLEEVDRRNLAVAYGYASLFRYCVKELRYSEAAAFCRIRAARASRTHPKVVEFLKSGDVHLDAMVRIIPHLEGDGACDLLEQAKGKSSQEVMAMLAALCPGPEIPDIIRPIGQRPVEPATTSDTGGLFAMTPSVPQSAPRNGEAIVGSAATPVSFVTRVRFAFTADEELLDLVKRAREVLRHKYPDGRLERVFKDALLALLCKVDPDRRLLAAPPRPPRDKRIRRIPAWVKGKVWKRDGGRCVFAAADGRFCASRDGLEYDHIKPWALGGVSDDPANIRLLCRAHNQFRARRSLSAAGSGAIS